MSKNLFGNPAIYFDVDETLVLWQGKNGQSTNPNAKKFHLYGSDYNLDIHWKHVELLKEFKQQGYKIIVWSAGGELWAQEVINVLQLNEFVDHCLSKPEFFVDDKFPEQFMYRQNRIYYPPEVKDSIIPLKKVSDND